MPTLSLKLMEHAAFTTVRASAQTTAEEMAATWGRRNSEARRGDVAMLTTTAFATPRRQLIPNPIGAVVARHILGPNYLRTVRVTQSYEALAAGQFEREIV